MMAKPMKTLELHYPMIQFLIITAIVSLVALSTGLPFYISQKTKIRTKSKNGKRLSRLQRSKSQLTCCTKEYLEPRYPRAVRESL